MSAFQRALSAYQNRQEAPTRATLVSALSQAAQRPHNTAAPWASPVCKALEAWDVSRRYRDPELTQEVLLDALLAADIDWLKERPPTSDQMRFSDRLRSAMGFARPRRRTQERQALQRVIPKHWSFNSAPVVGSSWLSQAIWAFQESPALASQVAAMLAKQAPMQWPTSSQTHPVAVAVLTGRADVMEALIAGLEPVDWGQVWRTSQAGMGRYGLRATQPNALAGWRALRQRMPASAIDQLREDVVKRIERRPEHEGERLLAWLLSSPNLSQEIRQWPRTVSPWLVLREAELSEEVMPLVQALLEDPYWGHPDRWSEPLAPLRQSLMAQVWFREMPPQMQALLVQHWEKNAISPPADFFRVWEQEENIAFGGVAGVGMPLRDWLERQLPAWSQQPGNNPWSSVRRSCGVALLLDCRAPFSRDQESLVGDWIARAPGLTSAEPPKWWLNLKNQLTPQDLQAVHEGRALQAWMLSHRVGVDRVSSADGRHASTDAFELACAALDAAAIAFHAPAARRLSPSQALACWQAGIGKLADLHPNKTTAHARYRGMRALCEALPPSLPYHPGELTRAWKAGGKRYRFDLVFSVRRWMAWAIDRAQDPAPLSLRERKDALCWIKWCVCQEQVLEYGDWSSRYELSEQPLAMPEFTRMPAAWRAPLARALLAMYDKEVKNVLAKVMGKRLIAGVEGRWLSETQQGWSGALTPACARHHRWKKVASNAVATPWPEVQFLQQLPQMFEASLRAQSLAQLPAPSLQRRQRL